MKLTRINYNDLNAKQKEIYNYQKVAAILADYGFNCIKLADDWNGADFLAVHKDGELTLKIQLKARLAIARKYLNKDLYMLFPIENHWCLIEHDKLVRLIEENTNWLDSKSWAEDGMRHPPQVPQKLLPLLEKYIIS
ncbi:hypothetical protein [Caviibacterium pharyngocola]|uniref:Uncharacterized protein n=1 Tax=Caviibacterium pharyngocola TaxID=28159 RepID=A0A2M8RTY8_9PAST|nr:hypothetical protein [Caviibacterium pharyngocola]PJG82353.1 hypothetical protein CVP04_09580 [Caviibacterium pharyngocola]